MGKIRPYSPRPKAKGRIAWNKGLTKNTNSSLMAISHKMLGRESPLKGKPGTKRGTGKAKTSEGEVVRRQKIAASLRGRPGFQRKHRGKGIRGVYRGIWCDSSWELAWILYHIHFTDLKFVRNEERFEYYFDGFKRFWVPDFKYVLTGEYIEIKGYMDKKDRAKIDHFKEPILVFEKEQMLPILSAVKLKFGENFTDLYDFKVLKKEGVRHYNTGVPRPLEVKKKISESLLRRAALKRSCSSTV